MQYFVLGGAALIIIIDQIIKWVVINNLSGVLTVPIISDVLHMTYVENKGAAFGIFDGNGVWISLLTSIILIAAIYLLMSKKITNKVEMCCVGLIIGGGVGNLIDRLFRGFVVDYIDVRIIRFAVFNFADCCVVVGAILFICYILFFGKDSLLRSNLKKTSNE